MIKRENESIFHLQCLLWLLFYFMFLVQMQTYSHSLTVEGMKHMFARFDHTILESEEEEKKTIRLGCVLCAKIEENLNSRYAHQMMTVS